MIFELAHQQGLLPLAWVALLAFRGKDPGAAWWWLAGAFFVSWITDTVAHFVSAPMMSMVYPVTQAALVGFVFLNRNDALKMAVVLSVVGVFDAFFFGVENPDILLRTVAWLSVVGIVFPLWQLGRLRTALLVYFWLGWIAWMFYAADPGWLFWSSYQLTRLAGIVLFCWAATSPEPHLKLYKR